MKESLDGCSFSEVSFQQFSPTHSWGNFPICSCFYSEILIDFHWKSGVMWLHWFHGCHSVISDELRAVCSYVFTEDGGTACICFVQLFATGVYAAEFNITCHFI